MEEEKKEERRPLLKHETVFRSCSNDYGTAVGK